MEPLRGEMETLEDSMLPATTHVAALDGGGRGVLIEQPVPELQQADVLIEVHASLVSPGTELGTAKAARAKPEQSSDPIAFGYTNAGVVVAVGKDVAGIRTGDRVAAMGWGRALHAEFCVVPQNLCVLIPDGVTFDDASSVHLAATALHAVRRAGPELGENAIIAGLGLVGQLCVQFLQLSGCHVIGLDLMKTRRNLGMTSGAGLTLSSLDERLDGRVAEFTRGYGTDIGVVAFGGDASEAFHTLYQTLRVQPDGHRTGRIIIVGVASITHGFAGRLGNVDVRSAARTGPGYRDPDWEQGRDYPIGLVRWSTRRNMEESLRLMADGRLKLDHLITHRFSLDRVGDAVDLLVEHPSSALGVVFNPDGQE